MNELPEGWVWKKLGEVCDRISEKHQPSRQSVFYVGLEHIEKDTGRILSKAENIEATAIKSLFQSGDILYGKLRPYLNKVAVADKGGVCSTDILVLRPKKLIVSGRFLHLLMLSHEFVNVMSANTSGVNLPRVPTNFVMDYAIPLPSLPVQHAIVTKIEEIFSELDHGVAQLKTARQQLKVYRQAVLKWAFEGRLTNPDIVEGELPEGWKWVKLGSFAVKITDGEHITPRRTQEGVYLLSARNIQNGFLDFSNVDYIPEDEYLRIIKRCNPEEGDILISCSGSIGRVCRVPSNVRFTLVRSVALIKLPRSIANSKFFEYQFQSPLLQKQIEKGKKATAQANLFLGPINNLEVLTPPLPEQHLIVSEIERRLSVCDKLEETIEGSLKAAEVLRAGVLKRAFEGRLVGG